MLGTKTQNPQPDETFAELDIENNPGVSFAKIRSITSKSLHLQYLHKHSKQDAEYHLLEKLIFDGFLS